MCQEVFFLLKCLVISTMLNFILKSHNSVCVCVFLFITCSTQLNRGELLYCVYFSQEKKEKAEEGDSSAESSENREEDGEQTITLRPLNMEDFRQAKNQASLFFSGTL